MNLDIFKQPDPSGKLAREKYVLTNHPDEYNAICDYIKNNNIDDTITFKEKVYLFITGIKFIPTCKNPNCDNSVRFRNTTLGYREYCSNYCIGTDPNVIKIKESKSLQKYGTKSPAQSKSIKDKIIKTNIEKYGFNSPMCTKEIQQKSKETLIKNWDVDNPSKNEILLNKRVESFKENIEQYKENFKKTSLKRYGVEHPWMNKEIRSKSTMFFYEDYKKRIEEKIDIGKHQFISFDKEDITTNLVFHCNRCQKDFKLLTYQFYYRINNKVDICTNCFPIEQNASIKQIEVLNFIKENYSGDISSDNKNIINPYEIDIFLPDLKIGFEFNGLWWHSDKFKKPEYHLEKFKCGIDNGINIYTIWEDDWIVKNEICKSFILNKIGKSNKIMGRKCLVKEVDYKTSRTFLINNHLQGDCKSSIRIGLYYNEELISLMTFSKSRLPLGGKKKDNVYELTRFCNKNFNTVIGGASKILKYFLNKYNPNELYTYSDNLISNGNLYEKLGFEYSHTSDPGYWWVVGDIRQHRFNWRKDKLRELGADMSKTEVQIMEEWGYYRVFNGGNKKWVIKK